jgi:2-methylisocitrate lyase-like PEP mutase family enzyme
MSFADRLCQKPAIAAPGVYDALSALLAEAAGFEALFLSGSALAYTRLGRPDVGLLTLNEIADACARVTDRVALPVIADADSGFGNAINVQRTVRTLEAAGAAVIQLEDQQPLKPADALQSRPLVSTADMVGRIRAALDARRSDACLISARTDAPATCTLAETLDRAEAYVAAGADLLFVEGLSDPADLAEVVRRFGPRLPLAHNLLEGGKSPWSRMAEVEAAGFALAYMPGIIVQTMTKAAEDLLPELRAAGSSAGLRDRMLDAPGMNRVVGTKDFVATAARYA